MTNIIPYAIVGIGGYGAAHLSATLRLQEEGRLKLIAVADPFPDRIPEKINELKKLNVKHYIDWRDMLEDETDLQAVSIPAPIPVHVPAATACFEKKLHVVLEKPPAVLIQEVDQLIKCARKNGVLCQVGFQNMTDPAAHKLKEYLLADEIGEISHVNVFGAWQRADSYYNRSEWAGRLRQGDCWVLDGPLNNPLCHYVQQGLFYAGPDPASTATPKSVRAELYRAHPIEGEDIVCSRAELDTNTTICCYLTTCAPKNTPPTVQITGSSGTAVWSPGSTEIKAGGNSRIERSEPMSAYNVIKNFILALSNSANLLSPIECTRNVILHNNACYKSSEKIYPLPGDAVKRYPGEQADRDIFTEVPGLVDIMRKSAREGKLFSELAVEWATGTEAVSCDFMHFDPNCLCEI